MSMYDEGLTQNRANHAPLSPLTFLERAAYVYPDRLSVVHTGQSFTWKQTYARCRRLASALTKLGVGKNDTVSVMLPNTPPMVEAHFGVPMCGAVLNPLNTRLDAETIAFMLRHAEAKVLITDREFSPVVGMALSQLKVKPIVIDVDDPAYTGGRLLGTMDYEALLETGDPEYAWQNPADEWDAISLLYTSGTPSTYGRCRCSIATAGVFPGPSPSAPESTSACAASRRRPPWTPSASTMSPTCAARRSSIPC
jgi:fatty-acyl-CoA synthase